MSMSYWPRSVAQILDDKLGYKHEILKVKDENMRSYLNKKLKSTPIDKFI